MKPNIIIFNPDQMRRDCLGHFGCRAGVTPNIDAMVGSGEACSFSNAFCQNPVCTPSRCSFMTGWYPYTRGHRTLFYMLREQEPCALSELKNAGYKVYWYGKNDLVAGQNDVSKYCDEYFEGKGMLLENGEHLSKNINFEAARGDRESDEYYSFYVGENKFTHISRDICSEHGALTPYGESITPKGDVIEYKGVKYLKFKDGEWEELDRALSVIEKWDGRQPFCIYLPFRLPHPPYAVEEPFLSMVEESSLPGRATPFDESEAVPSMLRGIAKNQRLQDYGEERFKRLRKTYLGMCARIDYQLGLLRRKLREKGLYDDTAIFFFSDHGDYTGDYGLVEKNQNTFQDCLVNVPLVIKPPKDYNVRINKCNSITELIDFTETLYSVAGINPAYTRFGFDLLPLIEGRAERVRDFAVSYGGRNYGETQASEISACSPDMPYMPRLSLQIRDDAPYHTKAVMLRTAEYKYVYRQYEKDEFYCLASDPEERRNLVDEPDAQALILFSD